MPRRLPVRALALALALAAAAASVDASFAPLADCRFFAHIGESDKPPLCQISKDGKFLTLTSAPPGEDVFPKSTSFIAEVDIIDFKKKDVPDGLRDLAFFLDLGLLDPQREITKKYGFNKFSKRWHKMRKKGPTKAVPALVGLGVPGDFEIKLDAVKFLKDKKGDVTATEYKVGKNARAKLVKKFGKFKPEIKFECTISYATPCKKLGLPQ